MWSTDDILRNALIFAAQEDARFLEPPALTHTLQRFLHLRQRQLELAMTGCGNILVGLRCRARDAKRAPPPRRCLRELHSLLQKRRTGEERNFSVEGAGPHRLLKLGCEQLALYDIVEFFGDIVRSEESFVGAQVAPSHERQNRLGREFVRRCLRDLNVEVTNLQETQQVQGQQCSVKYQDRRQSVDRGVGYESDVAAMATIRKGSMVRM